MPSIKKHLIRFFNANANEANRDQWLEKILRSIPSGLRILDAGDCYSRAPIEKPALLKAMQEKFGLRYEVTETQTGINATGSKPHYYSLNTRAADFGYQPGLTSLDGILQEAGSILSQGSLQVGGS